LSGKELPKLNIVHDHTRNMQLYILGTFKKEPVRFLLNFQCVNFNLIH